MRRSQETIAHIATGADSAGVGIVRLSGAHAHAIGRALVALAAPPPERRVVLRDAREADGEAIDRGLYLEFSAPRSMTGEDVAEFQGHGGRIGLARVLRRCVELGARAAEPGEFSLRAFEHGRLDLAQAEALAAGIGAATEEAHRLALRQARGDLSERVRAIRAPLVEAASALNADVDFPDEDLGGIDTVRACNTLRQAREAIDALLLGYRTGRLIAEGARIAIVGPPNAGKSSLLNALLGYERAIVSPVAGTTRDTVEERFALFGLSVRLMDTAGIRETDDLIEAQGVARARAAMSGADLVLALVAPDTEWLGFARAHLERGDAARTVWVWNKSDVQGSPAALSDLVGDVCVVSARDAQGLEALRLCVRERLGLEGEATRLVSIERHAGLLREAAAALLQAETSLSAGASSELALVDVRISIHRLSALTGENLDAEVYQEIFKRFCIGK